VMVVCDWFFDVIRFVADAGEEGSKRASSCRMSKARKPNKHCDAAAHTCLMTARTLVWRTGFLVDVMS